MKLNKIIFILLSMSFNLIKCGGEIPQESTRQIAQEMVLPQAERLKIVKALIKNGEANNPQTLEKISYLLSTFSLGGHYCVGRVRIIPWFFERWQVKNKCFPWQHTVTVTDSADVRDILNSAIKHDAKNLIIQLYKQFPGLDTKHLYKPGTLWTYAQCEWKVLPEDLEMLYNNLEGHKDPLGMAKFLLSMKNKDTRSRSNMLKKCVGTEINPKYHNFCKYINEALIQELSDKINL